MLLLSIYIASLVVGGILLGASMVLGHHGAENALHLDSDAAAAADAQPDASAAEGATGQALMNAGAGEMSEHGVELSDFWLPFVSVRFWVFFLCFFGLTGTVFTLLVLAGKWGTLIAAMAMGALTGFAASFIIQRLRRSEVGVVINEEDFKGQEGTVLLPLGPGSKGKVRLQVRGQTIDLVAQTSGPDLIERGRKVLVIDFQGNEAIVVHAPELESSEANANRD